MSTTARNRPVRPSPRPAVRTQKPKPPRRPNATRSARVRPMGYIASLDGIRAIAVIGVLIFHGSASWLPGGFLGVDVFFVLSGFLITSIILTELTNTGRVDFRRFYVHRARRLLPALILVLAASAVLVLLFAHDAAEQLRRDIVASLLYVTNWVNIFADQSYFEATGRPPLLQHLWSLAVEEQFYLVWPLLVVFLFRKRGRQLVGKVAIWAAIGSTLFMLTLSVLWSMPGDNDPSRLYFGTDTHAMSLLVGAGLATIWRPGQLRGRLSVAAQLVLAAIGAAALTIIVWSYVSVHENSTLLYRGGFLAFAAAVAVLIAVASHPGVPAARLLGTQPLLYIGRRSYGLYLWHWPIFMVTRPGIDTGLAEIPSFALQLGLTFGLAELSYRYVEMPIRQGRLGELWAAWKRLSPVTAVRNLLIAGVAIVGTAALLWAALSAIEPVNEKTYLGGVTEVGTELVEQPGNNPATPGDPATPVDDNLSTGIDPTIPIRRQPITAIGDSVMVGARDALDSRLRRVTIDAAVSRQSDAMYQRIEQRRAAGQLAPVVVVHPGTNGPAYEKDLAAAVKKLDDRERVILVTTRAPTRWMQQSNSSIRSVAQRFDNVRVADWESASAGQRGYFYPDGTHLTPAGAKAYAATIIAALEAP